MTALRPTFLAALLMLAAPLAALADEAAIRKSIAARMPDFPKIDEVTKTPVPGIFEIRIGSEVLYTDETGSYLFEGHLIDTVNKVNLTQARVDKLTAVDFAALPLKDAIVWKQGKGTRRMVVFADPNCGYCKKLERDLQQVKDVTVYTFLMPILGGDSPEKAKDIWCAKDNTKAWRDWMLEGAAPLKTMGRCDTAALERNALLGRKHKINGTPGIVFEDGKRVPGAIPVAEIEKNLLVASAKN